MSQTAAPTTSTPDPAAVVAGLPEHKHCEVCGRSIVVGLRVCSPECQKRFDEAVRQRKRGMYLTLALVGLLLLWTLYGRSLMGGT